MKRIICYLVFAFGILGCHHKDPDPCANMEPTTADFTIQEVGYTNNWISYNTDTVLVNQVILNAKQDSTPNTKYEWTIGATKVYKKKFTIDFDNRSVLDNHITVNLKVTMQPNTQCFPMDSGKQEASRQLVLLGAPYRDTPNKYDERLGDSLKRNSKLAGMFIGDYDEKIYQNSCCHWAQGKTNNRVFKNDTLKIVFGDFKLANYWGVGYTNHFSFTDFKRKNLFPDFFNLWLIDIDFPVGYREIQMDEDPQNISIYMPDNNTIQFSINGTLFFTGKRIN